MAVQSSGWDCSSIQFHFAPGPDAAGKPERPNSHRNRSAQNPANRGTADLQPSGDFGFADAGAAQLPDLRSVYGRSCRTTQPFAVFPCMSQASLGPFPQNLSFELGEYCE